MSNKPLGLTRNQLAEFLPNQRAIRAFEQLLKSVGDLLPSDIIAINAAIQAAYLEASQGSSQSQSALDQLVSLNQTSAINAGTADQKATAALDALQRIAAALQSLETAPAPANLGTMAQLNADNVDLIGFNQAVGRVVGKGQLAWNNADGCLDIGMGYDSVTLQTGLEMYYRIKASAAITNGQCVMFSGAVGASGTMKGAPSAAGLTEGLQIMGVATMDIPNNGFGYITSFGLVRGIDTSGSSVGETWADGDILYYNPAYVGSLTKVKPVAPNEVVVVAAVVNAASGGSGSLFIRPSFYPKINELSDVYAPSASAGMLLIRDAAQGRWESAHLTAGTNVTVTNADGAITISVSGAPPTGSAGGVLSGTYPNPGFAVDMATQAELDAHTGATGTAVHGLGTVSTLASDTDGALTANSDLRVATQKAVKTYVDNAVTGLLDFKGNIDCSTNPNYPAALKGDAYAVSVAGKIGGASGVAVDVGDMIVASADNAGGAQASVGSSWFILEHNLQGALLAANNLSDLVNKATARTNLGVAIGTDVEAAITAGTTAQYWRGDKTWRDFSTDVRAAVLTGLSTATNVVITAADTVLSALGKLQKQISDNLTTLTNHTSNTSNPHSVTKAQVGLGNVENTALSTWAGSANLTTLGTVTTGVWNGSAIPVANGGTGATTAATARSTLAAEGTANKGVANGYAGLDASAFLPVSQSRLYYNTNAKSMSSASGNVDWYSIAFGPYAGRPAKVSVVFGLASGSGGARIWYRSSLVVETGGASLSETNLNNNTGPNGSLSFVLSGATLTVRTTSSVGSAESARMSIMIEGYDMTSSIVTVL